MSTSVIDRRVLGALRFVDAETARPSKIPPYIDSDTARSIDARLRVTGQGVRVVRNASNLYVVTAAPGFDVYASTLGPDGLPAVAPRALELTVEDPEGRYLARRCVLQVPRPTSLAATGADSVFRTADTRMFLRPNARCMPGCARVRVGVTDANGAPLPGALVLVSLANGTPLGWGLSAWVGVDPNARVKGTRAEALAPVPGIPVVTWSHGATGSVLTPQISVNIEAWVDPARVGLGGDVPDPDDLHTRRDVLKHGLITRSLAAGLEETVTLAIDLSPTP